MAEMQTIRERLHPAFRPFTIRMADGRSFDVPEYESIALGRRVVSIIDSGDGVHSLNPQHITSISDITPREKAAS